MSPYGGFLLLFFSIVVCEEANVQFIGQVDSLTQNVVRNKGQDGEQCVVYQPICQCYCNSNPPTAKPEEPTKPQWNYTTPSEPWTSNYTYNYTVSPTSNSNTSSNYTYTTTPNYNYTERPNNTWGGYDDCADIKRANRSAHSGIYYINLASNRTEVYCDMETDGGGWTVFQRRTNVPDNKFYFNKTYDEYREGFGDLREEFWLGNDALHALTHNRNMSLRVDLEDFVGVRKYADYTWFSVGDEYERYRLSVYGYSGTAGDSMSYHSGQVFSTPDTSFCARIHKGGWWYYDCFRANLNGPYRLPGEDELYGFSWLAFAENYKHALMFSEMKLRPQYFNPY